MRAFGDGYFIQFEIYYFMYSTIVLKEELTPNTRNKHVLTVALSPRVLPNAAGEGPLASHVGLGRPAPLCLLLGHATLVPACVQP